MAVDPDLVFMTTKLDGKDTSFLPFNKKNNGGAGNPENSEGYRSAYLWEEVWQRDSLMDIFGRFLHLQVEEKKVPSKKGVKRHVTETMIFPRMNDDGFRQGAALHLLRQVYNQIRGGGTAINKCNKSYLKKENQWN